MESLNKLAVRCPYLNFVNTAMAVAGGNAPLKPHTRSHLKRRRIGSKRTTSQASKHASWGGVERFYGPQNAPGLCRIIHFTRRGMRGGGGVAKGVYMASTRRGAMAKTSTAIRLSHPPQRNRCWRWHGNVQNTAANAIAATTITSMDKTIN